MIAKSSIPHAIPRAVVLFRFRKYYVKCTWYIIDIVMNLKPAAQ